MTPEILLIVAVAVALAIAFVVLGTRSSTAAPGVAAETEVEEGVVSEPIPVAAAAAQTTVDKAEVAVALASVVGGPGWTAQFEPRSGTLDDAARLKLINDLGMLRAAWCVPLLERAAEEETDPENRAAALTALTRCRDVIAARQNRS